MIQREKFVDLKTISMEKLAKFIYVILGIIVVMYVFSAIRLTDPLSFNSNWVAGKYGKHCYEERNIPKTIKRPIYFQRLDECLDYVQAL